MSNPMGVSYSRIRAVKDFMPQPANLLQLRPIFGGLNQVGTLLDLQSHLRLKSPEGTVNGPGRVLGNKLLYGFNGFNGFKRSDTFGLLKSESLP